MYPSLAAASNINRGWSFSFFLFVLPSALCKALTTFKRQRGRWVCLGQLCLCLFHLFYFIFTFPSRIHRTCQSLIYEWSDFVTPPNTHHGTLLLFCCFLMFCWFDEWMNVEHGKERERERRLYRPHHHRVTHHCHLNSMPFECITGEVFTCGIAGL